MSKSKSVKKSDKGARENSWETALEVLLEISAWLRTIVEFWSARAAKPPECSVYRAGYFQSRLTALWADCKVHH
jgi:hypothetical protein